MTSRLPLIACLAVLFASPAAAQNWAGPLDPSVFPSWIGQDPIGMALREQNGAGAPATGPRSAPREVNPTSFRFTPSLERRRANQQAFLAQARRVDPVSADQLAGIFAGQDFIESVGDDLRPYGLRVDDLADAWTVWWINAWDAAHQRTEQTSARTAAAVRAQAVQAMAATPAFRDADDARRQQLAETLLIQAMLISAATQQASADPAVSRRVADMAMQGARGMGLDLQAMTLTEDGFVFD